MSQPINLYFITGFLGSGKTTLLNHTLENAEKKGLRLGVIINEWGQVSIDADLIPAQASEPQIVELNNGQVFCSCLTPDFIKALQAYAKLELSDVLVETSGMANPFPLRKLLTDLEGKTERPYAFRGMTALVDPENFLELRGVIPAVGEQIIASNRIVINKIDLCAEELVNKTRKAIEEINPEAEILETTQARIGDFFARPALNKTAKKIGLASMAPPRKEYPRPGNYVLETGAPLSVEAVREFMLAVLPHSLRVKGIIHDAGGRKFYVDGVNNRVEARELSGKGGKSKVVVIPKGDEELKRIIKKEWRPRFGNDFTLSCAL